LPDDKLIQVENLTMCFPVTSGIFARKVAEIRAVDDVTFFIRKGETLGLVGESGSGKTTIGNCILQLVKPTTGEIIYDGTDLCQASPKVIRNMRRRMQVIFQDPYSSLNPRHTVGDIIGEPLVIHGLMNSRKARDKAGELLETVGLRAEFGIRYPHMFSGGQRQRIGIARALSTRPEFIVCDEPVSALDISIQAQIVNLLADLRRELELTLLFISHDLSMVRHISNRIAVLYLGRIVELADNADLFKSPMHPYTRALISAVPIPDPRLERQRQRIILDGEIPSPMHPPSGCTFHPRCAERIDICQKVVPDLVRVGNRWVACHLTSQTAA